MFGRRLCLVLRLLETLGARHGLARCLPVHSPDALDTGTRGGAADGTALSGGGQKKRLAGVAVQGEVDQLGRPVAIDEIKESLLNGIKRPAGVKPAMSIPVIPDPHSGSGLFQKLEERIVRELGATHETEQTK